MGEALSEALAFERKYDWLQAKDVYQQTLDRVDEKDFLKKGELQERIGYCLHRAAFQAESREEFMERMGKAIEACEEAQAHYERSDSEEKSARINRCGAMTKYSAYWVERRPAEKLKLLDECLDLQSRALAAFWDLGNRLECGRTYGQFPLVFWARAVLGWDLQALKRILDDGIQWGEKAVAALSELDESVELARAHLALAYCLGLLAGRFGKDRPPEIRNHLMKAFELAEKSGDAHLLGLLHNRWQASEVETSSQDAFEHCEDILKYGEETRDNFLRSIALSLLAMHTGWGIFTIVDPDERTMGLDRARELSDRADHFCSIVSSYDYCPGHFGPSLGHLCYYYYRGFYETDPKKKREFLDKAVEVGTGAFKEAEEYEIRFTGLLLYLSMSLTQQARLESDLQNRKRILEKALGLAQTRLERLQRGFPFGYWENFVAHHTVGMIKASLADTERERDGKIRFLEEAAASLARGLELVYKQPRFPVRRGTMGNSEREYASVLTRLHVLTKDRQRLTEAVKASKRAAENYMAAGQVSRVAESCWELARAQDLLGHHREASETFKQASEHYRNAGQKIPQLRDFYQDYALHMQAWSEIETSRQCHVDRRYAEAKEHYAKAADLYKATQRWRYLSQNYLAWSLLEDAEDQSRRDQTQEARDLFQDAADQFSEAKESIKTGLKTIDSQEEKQLAEELIQASDQRREYCLGRAALEEAKLLDKQGDHVSSSRKYGLASESFQKVVGAIEDESERREIMSIAYLCQAWEKMTGAEARRSPESYLEASQLFDKAKESSVDEKAITLALGHGSFCRALEAGAMYERTQDEQYYASAKRHVETATNFYVTAGFKDASEYAKATNRLFDAYRYTYRAQLEDDLAKKAQLYQLAEKLLQTSAGFYVTAKHPEKSEQVLRVLENVRQEREITMSLTEVLHAPTITSTTTSFSMPSQTREQAVGLERFENANIQANLLPRDQEAKLGDVISLKIDLVNAGRGGAQLIKVSELLPERFEVIEKPDMYLVEDHGLNLKGKSLAPLRTEELNLVLKPLDKGTYQIKPRILYLDESGKYKSHEPEPATIVVKELGISGWLKGPTRDK